MTESKKPTLMIIDDSPQDIHLLMGGLQSGFAIQVATSGEEALKLLPGEVMPDLILLDVNMPGMNGYEVCRKLKEDYQTADIDVIFLSANDSTDEILQGLECGAVDYIVKPYNFELLLGKINGALASQLKRAQLKEQMAFATKVATTAMSESGDLGIVLNFLRESFRVSSLKELLEAMLGIFEQFGLKGSVYCNRGVLEDGASTSGEISLLELEVLARFRGAPTPFVERNERLIVTKGDIVMLIKRVPEDRDRLGRLRDYFMILLEGANAKLKDLDLEVQMRQNRNDALNNVILSAETALIEIQTSMGINKKKNVEILDELVMHLEEAFCSMGLTDSQEDRILDIVSKASIKTLDNLDHSTQLEERFRGIIKRLSEAAKHM